MNKPLLARAAITKTHRGLNSRHTLLCLQAASPRSGCLADLVPGEGPLPGLVDDHLLSVLTWQESM